MRMTTLLRSTVFAAMILGGHFAFVLPASADPCDGMFALGTPEVYRAVVGDTSLGASRPVLATVTIHNPGAFAITVDTMQVVQQYGDLKCSGWFNVDDNTTLCTDATINPGQTFTWNATLGGGSVDVLLVGVTGTYTDLVPIVSAELTKLETDLVAGQTQLQVYDHITLQRDRCR